MEPSRDAVAARETRPGITRPSAAGVKIVEADGGSENSIFWEQFEIDEGTWQGIGVVGDRERLGLMVVVVVCDLSLFPSLRRDVSKTTLS